jgi:ParB family chromosome partitioning protein
VPAKQALGRGLKALIPETPRARAGFAEIPLTHLRANPKQPRRHFDDDALRELADSILLHGVLQPLLVSEAGPDRYILITGERRWRAAKLAGLGTIPAVIREKVEDTEQLELALVENLQRRDLTPLEEARAFEHLRTGLGLTQADIASRVGMDRSTIANSLRLLKLPITIQELVESGDLTAGHGRALLAFTDETMRMEWAHRAANTGLSVRELERAAAKRRDKDAGGRQRQRSRPAVQDPNLAAAEEKLALQLGARVEIRPARRGGRIVITCTNQAEMMRVFDLLMGGD